MCAAQQCRALEGHKETVTSSGAGVTECGELVALWVPGTELWKNKMLLLPELSLQRLWIGFYPSSMDLLVLEKQFLFLFLFLSFIN